MTTEKHDALSGASRLTDVLGVGLEQPIIGEVFPPWLLKKPDGNFVRVFVEAEAGAHQLCAHELMEVKSG